MKRKWINWILFLAVLLMLFPIAWQREVHSSHRTCQINVRDIGVALVIYAIENDGRLPDSLGEMVQKDDSHQSNSCTPTSFICPELEKGRALKQQVPQEEVQWPAWVDKNSMYHYRGAGHKLSDFGPDDVLLWEDADNHQSKPVYVFADRHTRLVKTADLPALVNAPLRGKPSTQPATQP